MQKMLFSLFDRKLREHGPIFVEQNSQTMERSLMDAVSRSGESMLAKYPQDYDLYLIGEYETETAVVTPSVPPLMLANVADILRPEE